MSIKLLKRPRKAKWNEKNYILVYKLALEGLGKRDICETLNINPPTLDKWLKDKPGLAYAFEEGKSGSKKLVGNDMEDMIFGKLTPKLRRLWNKIKEVKSEPNAILRINRMFEKHGENVRKYLYLYALSRTRFNPTQACKRVCISKKVLDRWCAEDFNFARLVEDVAFHKENACEGVLMDLVINKKNPQVAMFVGKTLLKSRGYGEKVEIEHSGRITHENVIDLTMLSPKLQQMISRELREAEQLKHQVVVDGAVTSLTSTKLLE